MTSSPSPRLILVDLTSLANRRSTSDMVAAAPMASPSPSSFSLSSLPHLPLCWWLASSLCNMWPSSSSSSFLEPARNLEGEVQVEVHFPPKADEVEAQASLGRGTPLQLRSAEAEAERIPTRQSFAAMEEAYRAALLNAAVGSNAKEKPETLNQCPFQKQQGVSIDFPFTACIANPYFSVRLPIRLIFGLGSPSNADSNRMLLSSSSSSAHRGPLPPLPPSPLDPSAAADDDSFGAPPNAIHVMKMDLLARLAKALREGHDGPPPRADSEERSKQGPKEKEEEEEDNESASVRRSGVNQWKTMKAATPQSPRVAVVFLSPAPLVETVVLKEFLPLIRHMSLVNASSSDGTPPAHSLLERDNTPDQENTKEEQEQEQEERNQEAVDEFPWVSVMVFPSSSMAARNTKIEEDQQKRISQADGEVAAIRRACAAHQVVCLFATASSPSSSWSPLLSSSSSCRSTGAAVAAAAALRGGRPTPLASLTVPASAGAVMQPTHSYSAADHTNPMIHYHNDNNDDDDDGPQQQQQPQQPLLNLEGDTAMATSSKWSAAVDGLSLLYPHLSQLPWCDAVDQVVNREEGMPSPSPSPPPTPQMLVIGTWSPSDPGLPARLSRLFTYPTPCSAVSIPAQHPTSSSSLSSRPAGAASRLGEGRRRYGKKFATLSRHVYLPGAVMHSMELRLFNPYMVHLRRSGEGEKRAAARGEGKNKNENKATREKEMHGGGEKGGFGPDVQLLYTSLEGLPPLWAALQHHASHSSSSSSSSLSSSPPLLPIDGIVSLHSMDEGGGTSPVTSSSSVEELTGEDAEDHRAAHASAMWALLQQQLHAITSCVGDTGLPHLCVVDSVETKKRHACSQHGLTFHTASNMSNDNNNNNNNKTDGWIHRRDASRRLHQRQLQAYCTAHNIPVEVVVQPCDWEEDGSCDHNNAHHHNNNNEVEEEPDDAEESGPEGLDRLHEWLHCWWWDAHARAIARHQHYHYYWEHQQQRQEQHGRETRHTPSLGDTSGAPPRKAEPNDEGRPPPSASSSTERVVVVAQPLVPPHRKAMEGQNHHQQHLNNNNPSDSNTLLVLLAGEGEETEQMWANHLFAHSLSPLCGVPPPTNAAINETLADSSSSASLSLLLRPSFPLLVQNRYFQAPIRMHLLGSSTQSSPFHHHHHYQEQQACLVEPEVDSSQATHPQGNVNAVVVVTTLQSLSGMVKALQTAASPQVKRIGSVEEESEESYPMEPAGTSAALWRQMQLLYRAATTTISSTHSVPPCEEPMDHDDDDDGLYLLYLMDTKRSAETEEVVEALLDAALEHLAMGERRQSTERKSEKQQECTAPHRHSRVLPSSRNGTLSDRAEGDTATPPPTVSMGEIEEALVEDKEEEVLPIPWIEVLYADEHREDDEDPKGDGSESTAAMQQSETRRNNNNNNHNYNTHGDNNNMNVRWEDRSPMLEGCDRLREALEQHLWPTRHEHQEKGKRANERRPEEAVNPIRESGREGTAGTAGEKKVAEAWEGGRVSTEEARREQEGEPTAGTSTSSAAAVVLMDPVYSCALPPHMLVHPLTLKSTPLQCLSRLQAGHQKKPKTNVGDAKAEKASSALLGILSDTRQSISSPSPRVGAADLTYCSTENNNNNNNNNNNEVVVAKETESSATTPSSSWEAELLQWMDLMKRHGHQLSPSVRRQQAECLALAMEQLMASNDIGA